MRNKLVKLENGKFYNETSKPKTYQEYLLYIKSKEWSETKTRYWKSKRYDVLIKDPNWKPRCSACDQKFDSKKDFDVHHLTYRNFGHEKISELCHLCRNCHDKLHIECRSMGLTMFKNGDINGNSLWNITKNFILTEKASSRNVILSARSPDQKKKANRKKKEALARRDARRKNKIS